MFGDEYAFCAFNRILDALTRTQKEIQREMKEKMKKEVHKAMSKKKIILIFSESTEGILKAIYGFTTTL